MGVYGCDGVHGHDTQQNKGERSKNGQEVHVLHPWWPGKFPRTWCFLAFSENAHKRINMDDYGFRWVQWDARARAQGKTTEKEAQMVVLSLFCEACHGEKKTVTWQEWLGWPYRMFWGECRRKKGYGSIVCASSKKLEGKIYATTQKKHQNQQIQLIQTKQNKKKNKCTKWAQNAKIKTTMPQNKLSCPELWTVESWNAKRTEFRKRLCAKIGATTPTKPAK